MLFGKHKVSSVAIALLLFAGCREKSAGPLAKYLANNRAAVFVFLAPDCPLSQGYTPSLNRLHEQFQSSGVAFYGVFSGKGGDKAAVDDFVKTYSLKLSVVQDHDVSLAHFFGAAKTPEVFVVDSNGEVLYKGAIDNWAPELGQHRQVITEHYLQDALESFLQHRPIAIKQTNAVGCFIEL